jgi:hypothetical protein
MASTTTNRVAVALILARTARDLGYIADDLAEFPAGDEPTNGRRALARIARATPIPGDDRRIRAGYSPSDETWEAMLTIMRDRERQPDPFAGFPT